MVSFTFYSFLIIISCVFVEDSNCNIIQLGMCKEFDTVPYFDIERFLGEWHEIERFPSSYEKRGQCASKIISSCGRNIHIQHIYVHDNVQFVIHMNTTYSPGDEAIFKINESNIDPVGVPLSVIATDYDNYAVVFGCVSDERLSVRYLSAWILSRSASLEPDLLMQAYVELNQLPMASSAYLETVGHGEFDCLYYWSAHAHEE